MKGFRAEITVVGEGYTEADAIENMRENLDAESYNIEWESGADFIKVVECEIEE